MVVRLRKYVKDIQTDIKVKGSFKRNWALTFSGNAFSYIIGFAFTPFIARVYGPEVYGIFAFFLTIANIISSVSTLQFPSGFVAAKNEVEFHDMVKLTLGAILMGTFSVIAAIFLFNDLVVGWLSELHLDSFIYFFPAYFFLMGIDQLLAGWNIRLKQFERSAATKVISTIISKGTTLLVGFHSPVAIGMIGGNLLVYPVESFLKLTQKLREDFGAMWRQKETRIWETLRKFRGYPAYITPGVIISNLSAQLPVYFFTIGFTTASTGFFALAASLVYTPLSIVTNSSTTVFLQRAAELQQLHPDDKLKTIIVQLYKQLFAISFISLTAFAIVSEPLFVLIFGEVWRPAGTFASFIAIASIFNTPSVPLSVLFRLMFKERLNFILNSTFVVLKTAALWVGAFYLKDIFISVALFSAVSLLGYATSIFFVFKFSGLDTKRLFRDFIMVALLFIFLSFFKAIG